MADWQGQAFDRMQGLGGAAGAGLRIIAIVAATWIAVAVGQRAVRTLRMRIASRLADREVVQRAEPLGRVMR